jgi:hypothetical protein
VLQIMTKAQKDKLLGINTDPTSFGPSLDTNLIIYIGAGCIIVMFIVFVTWYYYCRIHGKVSSDLPADIPIVDGLDSQDSQSYADSNSLDALRLSGVGIGIDASDASALVVVPLFDGAADRKSRSSFSGRNSAHQLDIKTVPLNGSDNTKLDMGHKKTANNSKSNGDYSSIPGLLPVLSAPEGSSSSSSSSSDSSDGEVANKPASSDMRLSTKKGSFNSKASSSSSKQPQIPFSKAASLTPSLNRGMTMSKAATSKALTSNKTLRSSAPLKFPTGMASPVKAFPIIGAASSSSSSSSGSSSTSSSSSSSSSSDSD